MTFYRPTQMDVLRELVGATRSTGADQDGWVTPMWLGGRDGSGHSGRLAQLVRRGLAERKVRGGCIRNSYLYRATLAGRALLDNGEP